MGDHTSAARLQRVMSMKPSDTPETMAALDDLAMFMFADALDRAAAQPTSHQDQKP